MAGMTIDDAIKALKLMYLKDVHPFYGKEEMIAVRDTAIEALERQKLQIDLGIDDTPVTYDTPVGELEVYYDVTDVCKITRDALETLVRLASQNTNVPPIIGEAVYYTGEMKDLFNEGFDKGYCKGRADAEQEILSRKDKK